MRPKWPKRTAPLNWGRLNHKKFNTMNTQIFDQIALDVKTLEFKLYINVLGVQEQFPITHSKAQYLIESVNVSNRYKIDIEIACSQIYYIVTPLKKQG